MVMTKEKDEEIYLSIIVPFWNNKNVLPGTIQDIDKYLDSKDFKAQVILADTHSTDGSIDLAKKYAKEFDYIELIEPTDSRKGKGQGIHDGFAVAKGKYVMFMDADSSTPLFELDKLLPYVDKYDIVMGSRYSKVALPYQPNYFKALFRGVKSVIEVLIYGHSKDYQAKGKQDRIRQFISRGGNLAFTVLLNQSYIDQRCGFKLYRNNVAKLLAGLQRLNDWGFDTEYLAIAQKYKLKTIEVPIEWYDHAKEGETKINPIKDTFSSFRDIFHVQYNLLINLYSKKHIQKRIGKNIEEIILNRK
jgi:dolichyl-phosphate beta-glucosyltransferase